MKELERLQKKLNGKSILFRESSAFGDALFECVVLCEPGKNTLSVKPIGYEPEELYLMYHMCCKFDPSWSGWDIEYFERNDYCIASISDMELAVSNFMDRVIQIVKTPDGGVLDWSKLTNGSTASPSCSYA